MGMLGDEAGPNGGNLEQRDPNELNKGIGVAFEDIIGEPDGIHSIDCVWKLSYKCYNLGLNCCYLLLTVLCAVPISLCWGCEFACIAFTHIWDITPTIRILEINCVCAQKIFRTLVSCFLGPCCETIGLVFSKIKVEQ